MTAARAQIRLSGNRKTGPIPVSITTSNTCPDACPWRGAGCYAELHWLGKHWAKVDSGERASLAWEAFCARVAALPAGQLWRHNQAGDLPGDRDAIDSAALARLVEANRGKRGFSYTHKPVGPSHWQHVANARAVERANRGGLTINLSADSLDEADALADLGIGPVTVVLPEDAPRHSRTRSGRHVVVCPAQEHEDMTCERCRLCAVADRKAIVGFRAHGALRKRVSLKVIQNGASHVQ